MKHLDPEWGLVELKAGLVNGVMIGCKYDCSMHCALLLRRVD